MAVWLPLSPLGVIISRILVVSNDDVRSFIGTMVILVGIFVAGIILFKRLYIRKHFDRDGSILPTK